MKTIIQKTASFTITMQPLNEKRLEVLAKLNNLTESDYSDTELIDKIFAEAALVYEAIQKAESQLHYKQN